MQETVREICQNLISDSELQKFSYLGRKGKLRFKDYDNITKLIVCACSDSMLQGHTEGTEEEKRQRVLEMKNSVELYFTKEYIKHAKQRYQNSNK